MKEFLDNWAEAAYTSLGFFWMALWAFVLGYFLSSFIQVFVSKKKMKDSMGGVGSKSVLLGTFFGFLSSSCSFSALATTKALFKKGASFISSMAFMLASTNLVIELGIVISIFLGWQFVVAEYIGGLLLIVFCWVMILIIRPKKLIKEARSNMESKEDGDQDGEHESEFNITSKEKWIKVSKQFGMEWKMVWKDLTLGFTIAGLIAAFVPDSFFHHLFINTDSPSSQQSFGTLLEHSLVGPFAAFLTFIGSMGNIPLAALLFGKGVSFAGVMAFIFSDLVVFPVLRINAKYYGWKMSFFILILLFTALIFASMILHYGFEWVGMLPSPQNQSQASQSFFEINYSFYLNIGFLIIASILIYFGFIKKSKVKMHSEMAPKSPKLEKLLKLLSYGAYVWLIIGICLKIFID